VLHSWGLRAPRLEILLRLWLRRRRLRRRLRLRGCGGGCGGGKVRSGKERKRERFHRNWKRRKPL